MDAKLFLTVFGTVFLAEIGDKTQLATLLFASNEKHDRWTILAGACVALCSAAAIGVLAGKLLGRHVDPKTLRWVAGIGFIAIGVWTLVKK